MEKKYALCFLANDNVVDDLVACIKSFHTTNTIKVDIIIIHDEKYCLINKENQKRILKLGDNISFLCVDYKEYEPIFEKWKRYKVGWKFYPVFYKFECFGLKQYDTVVWLDTDTIVLKDISKLFTDNQYGIMGVVDKEDTELYHYLFTQDIETYKEQNYMNSGVISLSGSFLKKKEEMIQFALEFPIGQIAPLPYKYSGIYPEQDIINVYLKQYHHGALLPYTFNTTAWLLSRYNMKNYLSDVHILHYACQMNRIENCNTDFAKEMFKLIKK